MDKLSIVSAFNLPAFGKKDYEECARRLAKSLRTNGGLCKDIPLYFWIDKKIGAHSKTVGFLKEYNANIIFGKAKYSAPTKYGSWYQKLEALDDCSKLINTKYTIWLDTDYYVKNDFSDIIDNEDIAVAPMNLITNFGANNDYDEMWSQYYKYFNVSPSKEKVLTAIDHQPSHLYFTSSIIVFKNSLNFPEIYKNMGTKLLESGLIYCEKRFNQTILPIIITKYNLKWKRLSRDYSYLYHLNNYKLRGSEKLIHYCDNVIKEIPESQWVV